jgi:hypothetical protein
MYLSPDIAVPAPLSAAVAGSLSATLHRIESDDDVTAASADLAGRFPPPQNGDPAKELGGLTAGSGRGLFGNSNVWVTETVSSGAAAILRRGNNQPARRLWTEVGLA